jgi:hypothetical protein
VSVPIRTVLTLVRQARVRAAGVCQHRGLQLAPAVQP